MKKGGQGSPVVLEGRAVNDRSQGEVLLIAWGEIFPREVRARIDLQVDLIVLVQWDRATDEGFELLEAAVRDFRSGLCAPIWVEGLLIDDPQLTAMSDGNGYA